jgi:hypothetical protein
MNTLAELFCADSVLLLGLFFSLIFSYTVAGLSLCGRDAKFAVDCDTCRPPALSVYAWRKQDPRPLVSLHQTNGSNWCIASQEYYKAFKQSGSGRFEFQFQRVDPMAPSSRLKAERCGDDDIPNFQRRN